MNRKLKVTRAQKIFLQSFRNNPAGPPADQWPSPLVFRRWLRHPDFREAIESVRDALRFQADLHLASASTTASRAFLSPDAPLEANDFKRRLDLLHLSHTRQRFTDTAPPEPESDNDRRARDRAVSKLKTLSTYIGLLDWVMTQAIRDPQFLPFLQAFPEALAVVQNQRAPSQNPTAQPAP